MMGHKVKEAKALIPAVVKAGKELLPALASQTVLTVKRTGKFLQIDTQGAIVAIHPMLTGRFHYLPQTERRRPRTVWALTLDDGMELRLWDERLLSRIYVAPDKEALQSILPSRPDTGPDALSPQLTPQLVKERLQGQKAAIKSLILSEKLVSGIGNAYADEVLWAAGISPFRRGQDLQDHEVEALTRAIREVITNGARQVLAMMERYGLPDDEYREHMAVHRRGDQPCPRCHTPIQESASGGRVTSYCPSCQK